MQNPEEKKSPISINQLSEGSYYPIYGWAAQVAKALGWNAVMMTIKDDKWVYIPYNNVRRNQEDETSK